MAGVWPSTPDPARPANRYPLALIRYKNQYNKGNKETSIPRTFHTLVVVARKINCFGIAAKPGQRHVEVVIHQERRRKTAEGLCAVLRLRRRCKLALIDLRAVLQTKQMGMSGIIASNLTYQYHNCNSISISVETFSEAGILLALLDFELASCNVTIPSTTEFANLNLLKIWGSFIFCSKSENSSLTYLALSKRGASRDGGVSVFSSMLKIVTLMWRKRQNLGIFWEFS